MLPEDVLQESLHMLVLSDHLDLALSASYFFDGEVVFFVPRKVSTGP